MSSTEATHHHQHSYPHLTTVELAGRWRCSRETITRRYRQWGLRPISIAGALLFPIDQIEAVERRLSGESVPHETA